MTFGILCPGQSAQSPDMLSLLAGEPEAARVFDAFGKVTGRSIESVLADEGGLAVNAIAQPLICAVQMASYRCLADRLPEARLFAGYSVGELAAYGCSGTIGIEDTLRLARIRAEAMDAASKDPAAMIAVRGLLEADLLALCKGRRAYISIRNGTDRFVVAGAAADIDRIETDAAARLGHVTRLRVTVASHTPLMASAVAPFRRALQATTFNEMDVRLLAGIDGSHIRTRDDAISKLSAQVVTTVNWNACMVAMHEDGCNVLLELLPGADLTRMLSEHPVGPKSRALSQFRSLEGAAAWLSRVTDVR